MRHFGDDRAGYPSPYTKRRKPAGLKRIEVSLFDKDDAMDYIANYCASNNITIKSIEFAETAGAAIQTPNGLC